jgi:hypothetical protein
MMLIYYHYTADVGPVAAWLGGRRAARCMAYDPGEPVGAARWRGQPERCAAGEQTKMDEAYPAFSEQGDRVEAALEARLEATRALNLDETTSVVEIVAATYQKTLQLRYVIEALVAAEPDERGRLAAGLEDMEDLLNGLATLHATTRDKLYYAAQRVRLGPGS